MQLTANQLAFVLDAMESFDNTGDYKSYTGKYSLTENEVDQVILTFLNEFQSVTNK